MLINQTIDKLHVLNLMGMARALAEQQERADYQSLSFEDRLGMLADREVQDRENRRLERNLKSARLRMSQACIEDIDFRSKRSLDRSLILNLAEAQWVSAKHNILLTGATGSGKTFIACSLAHAALRRGHTALYMRAPRMLDELGIARADGRMPRFMLSLARVAVLVIDDFALTPLNADQASNLLEVIEDRSQLRSTIVTSQLPLAHWHEALGDPTLADAILDRLFQNAVRIELKLTGRSLRRSHSDDVDVADQPSDAADDAPASVPPAAPENRRARMLPHNVR